LANYTNLPPEDIDKIYDALGYKERRKIIRYLKDQGATQEENAKTRREIISYIGLSAQQTIEHCDKLVNIGVIFEVRGPNPPLEKWGGDVIKYYLVIKRLLELLAIIIATILILQKAPAQKINRSISRILNDSYRNHDRKLPHSTSSGWPADDDSSSVQRLEDYQEQYLQVTKEISDNCVNVQEAFVNCYPGIWQWWFWWWWHIQPYVIKGNSLSPMDNASMYAISTNLFTDYWTSAARLAIKTTLSNLEAYIKIMRQAGDSARLMSKIVGNAAKIFERVYKSPMPIEPVTIPPREVSAPDLTALEELRDELIGILQL
jgi:predicted transcriptional regulator